MTQEALKLALEALEKLWDIIDDIDTYSDMAKADEKLYRSLVERRQRKRFEETGITTDGYELSGGAITAIKKALAQPEQVPVAWRWGNRGEDKWLNKYQYLDNGAPDYPEECEPLYTTPPQRTWVGLTDDDELDWEEGGSLKDLVKAIEAKLKQKNGFAEEKNI